MTPSGLTVPVRTNAPRGMTTVALPGTMTVGLVVVAGTTTARVVMIVVSVVVVGLMTAQVAMIEGSVVVVGLRNALVMRTGVLVEVDDGREVAVVVVNEALVGGGVTETRGHVTRMSVGMSVGMGGRGRMPLPLLGISALLLGQRSLNDLPG